MFELWYGAEKSGRVQENTERLRVLLSGDLDLLDFDDEDAQTAGRVRAALERIGTPIGAYGLRVQPGYGSELGGLDDLNRPLASTGSSS